MRTLTYRLLVIVVFLTLIPEESDALNCLSKKIMNILPEGERDNKEIEMMFKRLEDVEATVAEEAMTKYEREITLKIKNQPENFILRYLLARLYLIRGEYYQDISNNRQKARQFLEQALTSAEATIQLKKDFSDAYRLAGDLYGWLIDIKGPPSVSAMIYGPVYSPKIDKLFKKAQQYDSNNPEVYLAFGRKYYYTPVLFGGNRKKAVESFEMAVKLCPDYYPAYVWLSRAYTTRGLIEQAEKSLQNALTLKPNGYVAKEALRKLKNR